MNYSWEEMEAMCTILEAEIAGKPVDRGEAALLAAQLAELCPDIARSMMQVAGRMAASAHQGIAASA
jgi:hypothetical protein